MTVNIINDEYIMKGETGYHVKLGGLTVYIDNLAQLLYSVGYSVTVFQHSPSDFKVNYHNIKVIGKVNSGKDHDCNDLIQIAQSSTDTKNDIFIFATDYIVPSKNPFRRSICINHGIAFDIPNLSPTKHKHIKNISWIFREAASAAKKATRIHHAKHVVCVDYNFINWYKTQVKYIDADFHLIPNFTAIPSYRDVSNSEKVSIVFARRLCEYRGSRLFTRAIIPLLEKYSNISITIAGTGADEEWMKKSLSKFNNVTFTSYNPNESVIFHQQHDIAVVPTIGSEGTSLSLLEAMAASCAVITTYVGGLSNIVIDNYNGSIIKAEVEELTNAIDELITDPGKRIRLSKAGYETVKYGFSKEKWEKSWLKLINEI